MDAFLSPKILAALKFASFAHVGQTRRDTLKTPYISHPAAVGLILVKAGAKEDVVVAGILHDVVEDTAKTLADIEQAFGQRAASLVAEVSEDKRLPYRERKDGYLAHLEHATPEARLISGADMLANQLDTLIGMESGDADLWLQPKFLNDLPARIAWDLRRIAIIKAGVAAPFMPQLEAVTGQLHQIFIKHT